MPHARALFLRYIPFHSIPFPTLTASVPCGYRRVLHSRAVHSGAGRTQAADLRQSRQLLRAGIHPLTPPYTPSHPLTSPYTPLHPLTSLTPLTPTACDLQPAACDLQPATCSLRPATCSLQPAIQLGCRCAKYDAELSSRSPRPWVRSHAARGYSRLRMLRPLPVPSGQREASVGLE